MGKLVARQPQLRDPSGYGALRGMLKGADLGVFVLLSTGRRVTIKK
jgi:hypothetical protein